MEIKLVGVTNNFDNRDQILNFCATAARICYSKFGWEKLEKEDKYKLIERILKSSHQSPFDHIFVNLYLSDIEKILAMTLNNERFMVTSEKSARYTIMKDIPENEKQLYDKWFEIFQSLIKKEYKFLSDEKIKKLSQENARYFTSVFTSTKMLYTTSLRQLNYIYYWFLDFLRNEELKENSFFKKMTKSMKDFCEWMEESQLLIEYYISNDDKYILNPKDKGRELSLFSHDEKLNNSLCNMKDSYGYNYQITYEQSFAYLAQIHRSRTIRHKIISDPSDPIGYYIPELVYKNDKLVMDWLEDIDTIANNFPQCQLIRIVEYGDINDFISKMMERLCGHAQCEAMKRTKRTLLHYLNYLKSHRHIFDDLYTMLLEYNNGPKCKFPSTKCNGVCEFGPTLGLERLI